MKVSLVISTYNWKEALGLCLLSVTRQTVIPTEVIIGTVVKFRHYESIGRLSR